MPATKLKPLAGPTEIRRVKLRDGKQTTVFITKYRKSAVKLRLVVFGKQTRLEDWCREHNVSEAISGGYDLCHTDLMLGETYVEGKKINHEPIPQPWSDIRGSFYIDNQGMITLDRRKNLPKKPTGSMMQVGPLLVEDGKSQIKPNFDNEGFTATAHLHDPDPSIGRHPRCAIGMDEEFIYTVLTNGRTEHEAGMFFDEMADLMVTIGCDIALNLDGGSSVSLVRSGKMLNTPKGDHRTHYPSGMPINHISSALVFEPRQ